MKTNAFYLFYIDFGVKGMMFLCEYLTCLGIKSDFQRNLNSQTKVQLYLQVMTSGFTISFQYS